MQCQYCHQENTVNGAFCMYCGNPMPRGQVVAAAAMPAAAGFCTQCGTVRSADAAFCENCGSRFEEPPACQPVAPPVLYSQPPAPIPVPLQPAAHSVGAPRRSLFWPVFSGIATFFVVAAGAGAAWWFQKQPARAPVAVVSPAVTTKVEPGTPQQQAAFGHFTRAMEMMEALAKGQGDDTLLTSALEQAERATQLDPSAAAYWHLLGHIYAKAADDQMASVLAEDALNKAIALNPANQPSRLLLARLLLGRESYSLALDQLEIVARKEPKLLNALLVADMCRAYVVDQQAARGEVFFRDMQKLGPRSSALRLGLAILLHEQGQGAAAKRQLADLLADGNSNPDDVEYARKLEQAWQGEQR